jgi:serine/threonine-protein kinase
MALSIRVPVAGDVVGGKYRLRECIGEGGMGVVFLADHLALGGSVAVKLLQPAIASDALVRRLYIEARAARLVGHPGAVSVIDCSLSAEEPPFIAMEYVPGRPLGALLAEAALPPPRALAIVQALLRTLEEVHGRGVVHGDIKSSNVIVEPTAGGDAVTLIDFGLARIADWTDTSADGDDPVSGTPEYMAPELVRGEPPTVATDLYGIGVILYELLTGRTPFEGGATTVVLLRQLEDEPVPPSLRRPGGALSAELDRIVLRALHKDPARRFASAGEIAQALAGAAGTAA